MFEPAVKADSVDGPDETWSLLVQTKTSFAEIVESFLKKKSSCQNPDPNILTVTGKRDPVCPGLHLISTWTATVSRTY